MKKKYIFIIIFLLLSLFSLAILNENGFFDGKERKIVKLTGIITEDNLLSLSMDECDYFIVDNKYRIDYSCSLGKRHQCNENDEKKIGEKLIGEGVSECDDNIGKFDLKFGSGTGTNIGKKVEIYAENTGNAWRLLDGFKNFNLQRISLYGSKDYYVKTIK